MASSNRKILPGYWASYIELCFKIGSITNLESYFSSKEIIIAGEWKSFYNEKITYWKSLFSRKLCSDTSDNIPAKASSIDLTSFLIQASKLVIVRSRFTIEKRRLQSKDIKSRGYI